MGTICQPMPANACWLHRPFLQRDSQHRLKGIAAPCRASHLCNNAVSDGGRAVKLWIGQEFPESRAEKQLPGTVLSTCPSPGNSQAHLFSDLALAHMQPALSSAAILAVKPASNEKLSPNGWQRHILFPVGFPCLYKGYFCHVSASITLEKLCLLQRRCK